MSSQMSSLLFLVVGISMALTPWLAEGGQLLASRFELHDVRSLLPVESEVRSPARVTGRDLYYWGCFFKLILKKKKHFLIKK